MNKNIYLIKWKTGKEETLEGYHLFDALIIAGYKNPKKILLEMNSVSRIGNTMISDYGYCNGMSGTGVLCLHCKRWIVNYPEKEKVKLGDRICFTYPKIKENNCEIFEEF